MTFAQISILLNDLTKTSVTILQEISTGSVTLGGALPDLSRLCTEIIAADGKHLGPDIPPVFTEPYVDEPDDDDEDEELEEKYYAAVLRSVAEYETEVKSLRQRLSAHIKANLAAFPPETQALLTDDLRRHEALLSDRFAR